MDVTCELERVLHSRKGGNVVLGVRVAHGSGQSGPRPDLSIAAALDRSASMHGTKLASMKTAVRELVERLGPRDRLVLVAFDTNVEVLAAGPVVEKRPFFDAITAINCRSGTNISLALETAGRYLEGDATGNVRRLLLLTDGEASKGDTTAAGLARIAEGFTKSQVATTCLGFGLEYDDATLALISGAGAGRLHHVNDDDRLEEIYAAELERMRALVAPWIRVSVMPAEAARVLGSRNTYPMKRDGRGFELELSDLRSHEARWVLFDLEVPGAASSVDEAPLGRVVVSWQDTSGERHEKTTSLVARYAGDEVVACAEANGEVREQMALLDLGAAKARALRDAEEGFAVEGSLRFGTSLARVRDLAPGSAFVRREIESAFSLSEKMKLDDVDPETVKRVRVEIRERESPTFRIDYGDAPPL